MKIGDKIAITYADGERVVAFIVGETAKQWKVELETDVSSGGEVTPKRVNKSMEISVIHEIKDIKSPAPDFAKKIKESFDDVVDEQEPEDNGGGSGGKTKPVIKKEKEKWSTKTWILIGFTLALATFAALVGMGYIELAAGINFAF